MSCWALGFKKVYSLALWGFEGFRGEGLRCDGLRASGFGRDEANAEKRDAVCCQKLRHLEKPTGLFRSTYLVHPALSRIKLKSGYLMLQITPRQNMSPGRPADSCSMILKTSHPKLLNTKPENQPQACNLPYPCI